MRQDIRFSEVIYMVLKGTENGVPREKLVEEIKQEVNVTGFEAERLIDRILEQHG